MTTMKSSKPAPRKPVAKKSTAARPAAKKTVRKPMPKPKPEEKVALPGHPRNNLIPPARFAEQYIHRHVGGEYDFDVFDTAMDSLNNVLLFGPTGSAKTTVAYAYAAERRLPIVNIACNGASDPNVIFGGLKPMADGSFHTMPADIYYVMRYGGIVNLDEINTLPPRIGTVFHSPLDARRIVTCDQWAGSDDIDECGNPIVPTFELHPRTLFIASMNPGYHGTLPMNEATLNRFAVKLPWGYLREVEEVVVLSERLIDFAWALRKQGEVGTISTPVTTNALIEFEQFAQSLSVQFAAENFLAVFPPSEREGVRNSLTPNLAVIAGEISEQLGDPSVYEKYIASLNADDDVTVAADDDAQEVQS